MAGVTRESSWSRLAAGPVGIHEVPAKHAEIVFDEAQVERLARRSRSCLGGAQAARAHAGPN